MIWLALIIPVLFAIAGLVYFKDKVAIWEPAIPLAVTLITIVIFKYVGVSSLTKDSEYWGNYAVEIRYYEDWDEWITQTCTRQVACGEDCNTDTNGNTTCTTRYCTETYDCSYRDYHPEYWAIILNDGSEISVSESYFSSIKDKFGTSDIFVDMGRDYYTDDGDMYKNVYPGTYEAYEFYATKHNYENKVQASTSVFNYPEVDEKEFAFYKLYNYPEISNDRLDAILHPKEIGVSYEEQKKFDYLNGMLGQSKKARVWVCLYNSTNNRTGFMQEALWKRGNKNELIACIGIDKGRNIQWVKVFGWSKTKLIEIETRNFLLNQKKLNLKEFGDFMYKEIDTKWTKTSFKEFEYLAIQPPTWAIVTTWIISFLSCIVIYIWIIKNEFTASDQKRSGYDRFN